MPSCKELVIIANILEHMRDYKVLFSTYDLYNLGKHALVKAKVVQIFNIGETPIFYFYNSRHIFYYKFAF